MRDCYRTPAGKQERQAQVEPLRREVRDAFVGEPNSSGNGSGSSNGAAANGSNGTGPAAVYTDTDISIVLKARRSSMLFKLTVSYVVLAAWICISPVSQTELVRVCSL